jgi:hypothetical protein
MIGSLLAGASSVLSGAGGLGGMAGGGQEEPSSASVTTTQTLTTGPMGGGVDKTLLAYGALAFAAFMVLSGKWRLK